MFFYISQLFFIMYKTMTVCYVWLLISSFLCSKRKPREKRNAKRSKSIPVETISPASITRRFVNLVHGDGEDGASTSTISAKRLLVLPEE